MEFSVKLAKLPDDVKIPDRLNERFRYDANQGRLIFRGFMTKCTYDEVSALSDDPDYHRAIEKLFVQTSDEVTPHSALSFSKFPAAILLATAGAAILGVAMWWGLSRHGGTTPAVQPDAAATVSVAR